MAKFIKIKVGDEDKLEYGFNLESIESVDLKNKRVYTIGAEQPYHISDQKSWDAIMEFVVQNEYQL